MPSTSEVRTSRTSSSSSRRSSNHNENVLNNTPQHIVNLNDNNRRHRQARKPVQGFQMLHHNT